MLGLGASSIGRTPSAYYQNARMTETYEQKISEEGFAVSRSCPLTGEDRLRGAIIEQLMCGMSVNLEATCRAHNFSLAVLGDAVEALEPYERSGLITREGYKIALACPHRMAIRVIASLFDKTERTADAPVSRAV